MRNKKRINGSISSVIILIMLVGFFRPVLAQEEVNVFLNNEQIIYDNNYGFPFIDENNRTQVPFRLTLELFGAEVSWDEKNQTAIAEKDGVVVKVPIGEKYIYRNDEIIINDTESIIIDNRTYLPIRIVMEAFGCDVVWVSEGRGVYIDYSTSSISISTIPIKYDLRDVNKVTSVKNQEDIGACWAFAALGAIESVLMPNQILDFSEDHLSLTHGYDLSQSEGGDFHVALSYFTSWSGPVFEEEDIYGDGIANNNALPQKHIQEAKILPYKDYLAIKLSILLYGGVQSSIYVADNIENSEFYNISTNAFCYTGNEIYNHDVVIVGWDDEYSKENFNNEPENNGAFICKNSYGLEFGEEGYFYISYEDTTIGSSSLVYSRIDDVNNYSNIYQTDILGWIGRVGYGSDTAFFSNVYEVQNEKEVLSATGFYATGPNTSYEVYLANDFQNKDDFDNLQLLKRGTFEYTGYYTVDFEPIEVINKFAVVIKITTPDSNLPVAVEYYREVPWLSIVDIDDGEGYMSIDGKNWERTEEIVKSNVCLKAFTNTIE